MRMNIWLKLSFLRKTGRLSTFLIILLLFLNYFQLTKYSINHEYKRSLSYDTPYSRRSLNSSAKGNWTISFENATGSNYQEHSYTFATLLCDDKLLQATSVLVYSLIKLAKTRYPVTVIALPNVSVAARNQLKRLKANIIDIDMLEYPFQVTPSRREQNKPCRYSKLQLWNMTQFKKIVFMDSDMMAMKNIDDIFEKYSELSAVVDSYPGIFNSGIFLLEPNSTTYKRLLNTYKTVDSYNVGDQGFLNWYFGAEWRANTSYHLPLVYNVLIKYKDSVIWSTIKDDIKVVHFTAETKPWNIHYSQHVDWRKNSDPVLYYKWIKTSRTIDRLIGKNPSYQNLYEMIEEKCDAEVELITENKHNLEKRFPVKNKFSVVLSTFDRFQLAMKLIKHYAKSKLVDHIFVLWHNPKVTPPQEMLDLAKSEKGCPVTVIQEKTDSLNNKFNPITQLRTQAVLIVDDDLVVDIRDIDYTFSIWKMNPYSIVGNFPRFHSYEPKRTSPYEYHVAEPNVPKNERRYSIMLTKFMFIRSEYLFWYTCLLPECIHAYIDDNMNCEDIAMQMMSSGMTNKPPVAVQVLKPIEDYGTVKGISALAGHLTNRASCLEYFHKSFGNKDILLYNNAVLSRFEKIPFLKILPKNNTNDTG